MKEKKNKWVRIQTHWLLIQTHWLRIRGRVLIRGLNNLPILPQIRLCISIIFKRRSVALWTVSWLQEDGLVMF